MTLTLKSAIEAIRKDSSQAYDIFKHYLTKADNIGAFLQKRKQARNGLPIAVKDNILVKGMHCTAGSKVLKDYIAPYNATVINKLKKNNLEVIGKTNLDEFAMGSSTENSAYQKTKNPNNHEYVPGGSSGGSAAAVADDLCLAALGSDTGGSIRQPASFCGVVGLKPTYGSVSRYGLIAMASSLDQIGVLTKNIDDAQILFDIIKGKDKKDSTSFNFNVLQKNKKLSRIGIPKEYFSDGLSAEIKDLIQSRIKKLQLSNISIEEISLPHTKYALAVYYLIMPAEVSANLARYDGIRYGKQREYFGDEVKRRIMLGTYVLSAGYYDAYYKKAQQVRTLIADDFNKAFEKVDLLITPTSPTTAFKFGEKTQNPLTMYLSDVYTVPVNLAGLPALSMPCGYINNMPVGLQIIGPHFSEELIFKLGKVLETIK